MKSCIIISTSIQHFSGLTKINVFDLYIESNIWIVSRAWSSFLQQKKYTCFHKYDLISTCKIDNKNIEIVLKHLQFGGEEDE